MSEEGFEVVSKAAKDEIITHGITRLSLAPIDGRPPELPTLIDVLRENIKKFEKSKDDDAKKEAEELMSFLVPMMRLKMIKISELGYTSGTFYYPKDNKYCTPSDKTIPILLKLLQAEFKDIKLKQSSSTAYSIDFDFALTK